MYRTAMQGKAIQGDASAMHACMHVCVCVRVRACLSAVEIVTYVERWIG